MSKTLSAGELFEYRIQRLYFHEGYFTRRRIGIHARPFQNVPLTDVDVFALSFSPELQKRLVVAECKSTYKSREELDRLIWVVGLWRVEKADGAVFAKASLAPGIKEFARSLGVVALDGLRISEREKDLGIKDSEWLGSHDFELLSRLGADFRKTKFPSKDIPRFHLLLRSDLWWVDPYTRIKKIQTGLKLTGAASVAPMDLRDLAVLEWIWNEGVIMFTVALLEIAGETFQFGQTELTELVNVRLASGLGTLEDFGEMIELMERYADARIREETGHYPSRKGQRLTLTPPPYTPEVIDLVSRFQRSSSQVVHLPRFEDYVLYQGFLKGESLEKGQVDRLFHTDIPMLVKQTQNVGVSLCRHIPSPPGWLDKIKALDSLL